MALTLRIFRQHALSLLLRRTYATTDFSQTTLEHLKAKARQTDNMLTMASLKDILNKRLGATTWLDRHSRAEKHATTSAQRSVRSQSELVPRQMIDSFSMAVLPLSKDTVLQDRYVTFLGHVRLGRLMEDLDLFAVWVAADHIEPNHDSVLPGNIVTLLVDSIDFSTEFLQAKNDIRVSGYTSWCGHSTIETELWMEQKDVHGEWKIFTNARFLMALRDPTTNKAAAVNRLVPSDAFESALLARANERRRLKRAAEKLSLYNVGPNPSETKLLHDLIYENVMDKDQMPFRTVVTPGALLVERARLSSTVFSHPEDRNMYTTVFGGYLMRLALELSWACAWVHTKQLPQLVRIDEIRFHRPVAVASLLRLHAYIIYTEGYEAVVKVTVFIYDPATGDTFRTNDFHFVHRLRDPPPSVLPSSYESVLMYLEGRRRLLRLGDNERS